jgi:hypothetical protein
MGAWRPERRWGEPARGFFWPAYVEIKMDIPCVRFARARRKPLLHPCSDARLKQIISRKVQNWMDVQRFDLSGVQIARSK